MKHFLAAVALAALSTNLLVALAQSAGKADAAATDAAAPASACPNCGMVTAIRPTALRGEPQWMSTISGGVIGRQPSGATGSAGTGIRPFTGHSTAGALPGQEPDLGARQRTVYEVVVVMDDQTTRKLHYEHRPALSVGDRVQVSGGQVYLR